MKNCVLNFDPKMTVKGRSDCIVSQTIKNILFLNHCSGLLRKQVVAKSHFDHFWGHLPDLRGQRFTQDLQFGYINGFAS